MTNRFMTDPPLTGPQHFVLDEVTVEVSSDLYDQILNCDQILNKERLPMSNEEIREDRLVPVDYATLLPRAIELAAKAHGTTMNKDGTPYILHPLRLMMAADGYPAKIVAVLHDTIEDTPLTLSELLAEGFPVNILEALEDVTKREGEEYEAFIERIARNPLAVQVKLLDLYDNIDVTRLPELGDWELKRTAKYHRAILRLKETLKKETL